MALVQRDWFTLDWPSVLHRFLDEQPDFRVEEFVDDGKLVVRAELPGVDPDKDVEITVSDGVLHIHAERKEETTHEGKHTYRSEFRYGAIDRNLLLPAGATEEDIAASYKDGILEVRVPLPDDRKSSVKRIEVNRA